MTDRVLDDPATTTGGGPTTADHTDGCAPACLSRRSMLAGVGVAGVAMVAAGCSSYGGASESNPPPATGAGATGAPPQGGGAPIAQVADIPVEGGKIFSDQKVVITQPESGTIKAFTTTCPHQGCQVSEVADGTINCLCHGSKFDVSDGSVTDGPAKSGLTEVTVNVADGAITLA